MMTDAIDAIACGCEGAAPGLIGAGRNGRAAFPHTISNADALAEMGTGPRDERVDAWLRLARDGRYLGAIARIMNDARAVF